MLYNFFRFRDATHTFVSSSEESHVVKPKGLASVRFIFDPSMVLSEIKSYTTTLYYWIWSFRSTCARAIGIFQCERIIACFPVTIATLREWTGLAYYSRDKRTLPMLRIAWQKPM